jgi:hypothetical protein
MIFLFFANKRTFLEQIMVMQEEYFLYAITAPAHHNKASQEYQQIWRKAVAVNGEKEE